MMMINRVTKTVQSQSHRTENWLGEEWTAVPLELEALVLAAAPCCELSFDESGNLTAVRPEEKPRDYAGEIKGCKQLLNATDYQVMKCMEYQMTGQELPYDLPLLHEQRQAARNQINALEGMMTE